MSWLKCTFLEENWLSRWASSSLSRPTLRYTILSHVDQSSLKMVFSISPRNAYVLSKQLFYFWFSVLNNKLVLLQRHKNILALSICLKRAHQSIKSMSCLDAPQNVFTFVNKLTVQSNNFWMGCNLKYLYTSRKVQI